MAENKRLVIVDYLKAFCVVLVIITHSDFLNDAMLDKNGLWYLLAVNKAVPIFMFLSGMVFTFGAEKLSFKEHYLPKRLRGKLMRLLVPTFIAFFISVIIEFLYNGHINILNDIILRFLKADFGRGSYYFAIMIQFVFTAPILYELIKKYEYAGVWIIGIANLIYELLWTLTDMPAGLYRILVFRYLLIIAFGMYMTMYKDKIKTWALPVMAVVGLIYILLPYATEYEYKIFTVVPWNKSGMMSAFYVAVCMYTVFKFFGKTEAKSILGRSIAKIGQASYHIMYTQMIYFVIRPAIDARIVDITLLPLWSQYIVDIVVSCAAGLVFCMLDNKIFGKFYKTK